MALVQDLQRIMTQIDALEAPGIDDISVREYVDARRTIRGCFDALSRLVERLEKAE